MLGSVLKYKNKMTNYFLEGNLNIFLKNLFFCLFLGRPLWADFLNLAIKFLLYMTSPSARDEICALRENGTQNTVHFSFSFDDSARTAHNKIGSIWENDLYFLHEISPFLDLQKHILHVCFSKLVWLNSILFNVKKWTGAQKKYFFQKKYLPSRRLTGSLNFHWITKRFFV